MKKFRIVMMTLAVIAAFGIYSCSDDFGPKDDDMADMFGTEFTVFNETETEANIIDATIDYEMEASFPMDEPEFMGPNGDPKGPKGKMGFKRRHMRKPGMHLGRVLYPLKLTEDQRGLLKELAMAHRDCVKESVMEYRIAILEIVKAANEERRAIIVAMKNGDMPREEAMAAIKEINMRLREDIKNNVDL